MRTLGHVFASGNVELAKESQKEAGNYRVLMNNARGNWQVIEQ